MSDLLQYAERSATADETYTLRFEAAAAGYVSYHLDWYEHTNS